LFVHQVHRDHVGDLWPAQLLFQFIAEFSVLRENRQIAAMRSFKCNPPLNLAERSLVLSTVVKLVVRGSE
jgi:hypothetical protein